jgi:hypothetical protein
MGMESVGGFKLRNNGGFVCAGQVEYIDTNGNPQKSDRWGFINLGDSEVMRPNEKGVPDGAIMQMYIDIRAGNDRTGGTYFIYDSKLSNYAEYDISGTTLNSDVHFDGIKN